MISYKINLSYTKSKTKDINIYMKFKKLYGLVLEQDFSEPENDNLYPWDDVEITPEIDVEDPDPELTDDFDFQKKRTSKNIYQIPNIVINIPELDINSKLVFDITKSGNSFITTIYHTGTESGEEEIETHPSKFAALAYIKNYRKQIINSLKDVIDQLEDTSSAY